MDRRRSRRAQATVGYKEENTSSSTDEDDLILVAKTPQSQKRAARKGEATTDPLLEGESGAARNRPATREATPKSSKKAADVILGDTDSSSVREKEAKNSPPPRRQTRKRRVRAGAKAQAARDGSESSDQYVPSDESSSSDTSPAATDDEEDNESGTHHHHRFFADSDSDEEEGPRSSNKIARVDKTESLTKGCFFFPARAETTPHELLQSGGFESLLAAEPLLLPRLRRATFTDEWQRLSAKLQHLQTQQHASVFADVVSFVQRCLPGHAPTPQLNDQGEVPAATLLTGVNLPDHEQMFELLAEHLRANLTPHVVSLRARECSSLKAIVKRIVDNLVQLDGLRADLHVLRSWYRDQYPPEVATRPVVLLFQDFGAFDGEELGQLVCACARYSADVPFCFIFGVASAADAVQQHLPWTAVARLSLKTFHFRSPALLLTDALRTVFFSPECSFKLGPTTLKQLIKHFTDENLSLNAIARTLKFALLSFCRDNPTSALLDTPNEVRTLARFTRGHLEHIRARESFRSFVERQEPQEQRRLLLDDTHCAAQTAALLAALRAHHIIFHAAVEGLHAAVNALPMGVCTLPSGLPTLYMRSLKQRIYEGPAWASFIQTLRLCTVYELVAVLRALAASLAAAAAAIPTNSTPDPACPAPFASTLVDAAQVAASASARLGEMADTIETILDQQRQGQGQGQGQEGESATSPMVVDSPTGAGPDSNPAEANSLPRRTSALALTLGPTADSPGRGPVASAAVTQSTARRHSILLRGHAARDSPIVIARDRAIDVIGEILVVLLRPPSELPLHELVYFNQPIADTLHGRPRTIVQAGLSTPALYLPQSMPAPDVSVAYRLHLECGRLINLYDWLEGFNAVVGGSDSAPTEEVQARFVQAVAELQLLGFVRSTHRKTDHVVRLTWGHI
eukprot:m.199846 g.199846  ORF g.199846 m.199846 type:complete len:916 (+) comp15494_c0_seq1:3287-6034(+)